MNKIDMFDIPNVVWLEILSLWIDSRDLTRLDSAIMNKNQRKVLLGVLQDPHFVLDGAENTPKLSYIIWLAEREVKVRKLGLSTTFLRDHCNYLAKLNVTKLETLALSNHKTATSVKDLNLIQMIWRFAVKSDDPYEKLFVRCSGLKHIDFGNEVDSSFGKIGMFCSKLQSIKAIDCKGLNDTAIENITQHCRENIQSVVLRGCDTVTSASVFAIAANCPNVRHVDLSYGTALSERSLIQLAQECRLLESINFEGLHTISDKVIATVAECCNQLEYFNIDYYKGMSHDGIDPTSLRLIAENCTKLADFVAPDFNYKVREGRATLKFKGSYLRLPKLRNILLNSPDNIVELHAPHIKYFNDDCLAIAVEKYRGHLQILNVNGCEDVTDVGLARTAAVCPNLRTLDLSNCRSFTHTGVMGLALQCRALSTVYLKKCTHLSEEHLIQIASLLGERLTRLDLSCCTQVTEEVLLAICAHNTQLQVLDVTGCDQLSKEVVSRAAATCPHIEHLCFKSKILY